MSAPPSHSANQSAAAPSSSEAHTPGRPAGILPMPAQMLAASNGPSPPIQLHPAGRGCVPTTGGGDNAAEGPAQKETTNMANTKEKTPMCLLNELARFNKLQPKYELTAEKGPPHEKIFTICLTLGTQKYEASGQSIKKAQHAAAAQALAECGMPQPIPRNNPPKMKRRNISPNTDAMTPTVQLNSLAMKTGKQVHYVPLNQIPPRPYYGAYRGPRTQHHGMPHQNPGVPLSAQSNQVPHPSPSQQSQGQEQGQHLPPFHPPSAPQMTPPPLQQQQGQTAPPPGMPNPQGVPAQGPGPMNQQPQQQQQQQQPPQQQSQGGGMPLSQHPIPGHEFHPHQQGGHPYSNQHHRPYWARYPRPYVHFVKVTVGDREFVGEGKTQKAARQNAACRALHALENEPMTTKVDQATTTNVMVDGNGDASNEDEKNVKSDISLVYEAANLHNLNVVFKVLDEHGQPHLKIFRMQCIVGDYVTEAEGPSKKAAKRVAAELMLPKLKGLPPIPCKVIAHHRLRQQWAHQNRKKKPKSLQKTPPEDPNFGAPGLHPVSRLVQILQAKNEREPEFSVIEERPFNERVGPHMVRRREFTVQVLAASKTASGKGKTKKAAKRLAAENMLKQLGYSPTPEEMNGVPGSATQPSKSALKTSSKSSDESDRKVTFKDDKQKSAPVKEESKEGSHPVGSPGTKLAPGLLPMMPGVGQHPQMFPSGPAPPSGHKLPGQGLNRAPGAPVVATNLKVSPTSQALSDVARDLLSLGHSPTAEAMLKGAAGPHPIPNLSRASQQLEYLAKVNSLNIRFNDFPKGNNGEYQSVVYITTDPQMAYRGNGGTVEAAHDAASIVALRSLAGITDGDIGKKNVR